jgi:voltage-gated potassium channel
MEDGSVVALVKKRVFDVLDVASTGDTFSRAVDLFIVGLILLNVIAVMLETVHSIAVEYYEVLHAFDLFSVAVFTIEYLVRIWACTSNPRYADPLLGRLKFAARPMIVIDLLAILPFFLPALIPMDLRAMRILRMFRLLRVFKLARYSSAMQQIGRVVFRQKEELLVGFGVMIVSLLFASSLMWAAEHEAQPDAFGSIPQAMWWGVATLTTVGYGDVTPITPLGQLLAGVIAIIGVGMFAMPAAILAQGFSEEWQKRRAKRPPVRCPHCQTVIHGRRWVDADVVLGPQPPNGPAETGPRI